MKTLSNKLIPLLSFSVILMLNACTKPQVVATSGTHLYNYDFGIVQDLHADAIIQQEYIAMSQPTQIEIPVINDPEVSTELVKDPDAFYAHEYVPTPPVITYKYEFDPKFYSKAEWRKMDLE